jgi:hypothetical protein
MKKVKSRVKISITLDKKIKSFLEDNFQNKSKYIEHLIYTDLIKNEIVDDKEFYII